MAKKIETDTWTFIRFWAIPGIAYLLYLFLGMALEGLIIIGISIFLSLALRPLVKKVNGLFTKYFGKDKKHKTLSAVFAYLIVVVIIGGIVAIVGPVVVNETAKFIQNVPENFEETFGGWNEVNELGKRVGVENLQLEITNSLTTLSNKMVGFLGENLVSSVSGVANAVMKIVLVLVLTLLFLLEGPEMMRVFWRNLESDENKKKVVVAKRIAAQMSGVISTYVSRQTVVAFIDGTATSLIVFGLSIFLDISPTLAIPMGMTTMLFYLIPMFGQFIGGTLVTILLFFSSPIAALVFAIIYITYSQIENNFIAPKIQGNALKLQPILILCAITIGMYMFGLLGAIIAIPIAGCIRVLIDEYPNIKAARE